MGRLLMVLWALGLLFSLSVALVWLLTGLYVFLAWFLEWATGGKLKLTDRSYGEPLYDPNRHR